MQKFRILVQKFRILVQKFRILVQRHLLSLTGTRAFGCPHKLHK